jgi:hypothetical protein
LKARIAELEALIVCCTDSETTDAGQPKALTERLKVLTSNHRAHIM